MKKVLFVATVTSHINTFHIPYLKWFKEHGYEVHVASRGNQNIEYCDKHFDLEFERSPLKLNNLRTYNSLKKIIEENQYQIIHSHTPVGGVLARLAAKKARKKYGTKSIYTAHGFHFYKGAPMKNWLLYYPIEWYLAKYTDTLITINQEDFSRAKSDFHKRCKDIQYVPGVGIDTSKFDIKISENEKQNIKKTLGLKKQDFILMCVARLDKNKNQMFLIDVMKQLVKENKDVHLLLAGRDELNGYYQSIVQEKKLEKNIHFLGNRDDVPNLMQISDIVVSASKREGLPVNVIEAFASRKPVIAINCRGMSDLIEENLNGYIADSTEKMIEKILTLKKDKAKYEQIAGNNFYKSKNYDLESIIKLLNDIYMTK